MRNLILGSLICLLGCASQQTKKGSDQFVIEPGTYRATVNVENMDPEVRAYSATSQINFGFEADNTFIYNVVAMGQTKQDEGKWEIRGDSLYIHSLGSGPDSAFKIIKNDDGSMDIIGPNHFRLTPEEKITPIKE